MGERKGTNKWYPPDFDPRLHRNLDAYHGTHALRERAKKVKQGIIVIRFEMPYNIWCGGCGRHVAMGVRYNAEKKKVGMYYSTPVYEFNMKCHLCDQRYLIRTDPGNYDYTIVSGARRKEQRWDPTDTRQIVPDDSETRRRLATDAMFKLEHGRSDETRGGAEAPRLEALVAAADDRHADDVRLNRLVRSGLRTERQLLAAARAADADVMARHSLAGGAVDLLPETEADAVGARLLRLGSVVPATAVRPHPRRRGQRRSFGDTDDGDDADCPAFKSARLDELRQRTGNCRRQLGVVVASATSSTMSATSSTMSATSSTMSSTSSTMSATSSTMSATSSTMSAASPKIAMSATSSAMSATSSTMSAASPKIAMSATSPTAASCGDDDVGSEDGGPLGGLVQYSASPSSASDADVADDAAAPV